MERRDHTRKTAELQVIFLLNGREIVSTLRNISDSGAFLVIEQGSADLIDGDAVGKEVRFIKGFEQTSLLKERGKIVRYFKDETSSGVAVRFEDYL